MEAGKNEGKNLILHPFGGKFVLHEGNKKVQYTVDSSLNSISWHTRKEETRAFTGNPCRNVKLYIYNLLLCNHAVHLSKLDFL